MSAQAGVFYRDRRPIAASMLAGISTFFDECAPDSYGDYCAPGLALLHRGLHVSAEDRREQQPARSAHGLVLSWDGRLDNREDILAQLHPTAITATDAEIVLAALERWQMAALPKLIGDWSLVFWNEREQSLSAASDYMGTRPLYYVDRPEAVHWSTSLRELVTRLGDAPQVEDAYVVGQITGLLTPNVTPFRGVMSVPSAHTITWSADRPSRKTRFWDFTLGKSRESTPADYAERLRAVFSEAVRVRLRSEHPVWAELSGGFDSSSVVCMADHLRQCDCRTCQTPLHTISYYSDLAREVNERPFAQAVTNERGLPNVHIRLEDMTSSEFQHLWVTPAHFCNPSFHLLTRAARESGRVLLTGIMGDAMMGNMIGCPEIAAARFQEGHFLTALRELRSRALATDDTVYRTAYHSLKLLGPRRAAIRRKYHDTLRQHRDSASLQTRDVRAAFALSPRWEEHWHSEVRRLAGRVGAYGSLEQLAILETLVIWADTRALSTPAEFVPAHWAHPYAHRPLVEFILNVPLNLLAPAGHPRALMRAALSPLLPQKVSQRFGKGNPQPFYVRETAKLAQEWLPIVRRLKIVERGYVDHDRLTTRLKAVLSGSSIYVGNIPMLFRLERWLRQLEGRRERPMLATAV